MLDVDLDAIRTRSAYLLTHRLSAPESEASLRVQIRQDVPALLREIARLREQIRQPPLRSLTWPA
jgi:hypothetical protein